MNDRFSNWRLMFRYSLALLGLFSVITILVSSDINRMGAFTPERSHYAANSSCLFWIILTVNLRCFLIQWLGLLLLCIPTVAYVAITALQCGIVLGMFPLHCTVSYLVPHGVLEIPAFIWNGATVLSLQHRILHSLLNEFRLSRLTIVWYLIQGAYAFILLVVAAYVESYLTMQNVF